MDRITRGAASASLGFHGVLAALALVSSWHLVHEPPPPEPPPTLVTAAAPRLVLAPAPAPQDLGDLPALRAAVPADQAIITPGSMRADPALPEGPPVVAAPLAQGDPLAGYRLPAPMATPTAIRIEQDRYQEAANWIDIGLRREFTTTWRSLLPQVSQRRLWLRLVADAKGNVIEATMLNSSGCADLDRAVTSWFTLRSPPANLPPGVAAGMPHVFAVRVPNK